MSIPDDWRTAVAELYAITRQLSAELTSLRQQPPSPIPLSLLTLVLIFVIYLVIMAGIVLFLARG